MEWFFLEAKALTSEKDDDRLRGSGLIMDQENTIGVHLVETMGYFFIHTEENVYKMTRNTF